MDIKESYLETVERFETANIEFLKRIDSTRKDAERFENIDKTMRDFYEIRKELEKFRDLMKLIKECKNPKQKDYSRPYLPWSLGNPDYIIN
jgi:hypothetical protein